MRCLIPGLFCVCFLVQWWASQLICLDFTFPIPKKRYPLFLSSLPDTLWNRNLFFFHTRRPAPHFCFTLYRYCGKRSIKTKQHFAGTQTVRIFLMACCLSQTTCCWLVLLFPILICWRYRESCLQISTFAAQTKTLENVPLGYEPVSLKKMCWLALSVTASVIGILRISSQKKGGKKNKCFSPLKQSESFCYDIINLWKCFKLGVFCFVFCCFCVCEIYGQQHKG